MWSHKQNYHKNGTTYWFWWHKQFAAWFCNSKTLIPNFYHLAYPFDLSFIHQKLLHGRSGWLFKKCLSILVKFKLILVTTKQNIYLKQKICKCDTVLSSLFIWSNSKYPLLSACVPPWVPVPLFGKHLKDFSNLIWLERFVSFSEYPGLLVIL